MHQKKSIAMIIFITFTLITIVAVTFNKYIVQLILKYSPELKNKDDIGKKEMSDLFVENSNGGISTLSKEELKDLFSMD